MSGPGSGRRAATVAPPPARTALAAVYTSASETAARTPLAVAGRLPAYLRGSLLRNGAGTFELAHAGGGGTQLAHWFDAVSMLHRFEVDGRGEGGVWYTSRTTAPGMVRAAASVRKESWEGGIHFGVQDPCKGIFGKAMALWRPETRDPDGGRTSNVGVTVETVPGLGLVSRTDMTVMFRIDEETLEAAEFASWATVDVVAGAGKGEPLVGEMSAAHGEYDASTKEYFNYSYKLGGGATSSYKVFCVGADGAASVLATVPYRPTYCHSLALTDSYVVLVLYPLHIGVLRMLLNKSLLGSMDFDAAGETRFFVISRAKGGVVATYAAAPFWCFHTINAWETPAGDVHIDLCHYENADIIGQLYTENLRTKSGDFFAAATAHRYTLAGVAGVADGDAPSAPLRATHRQLAADSLELTRINSDYARREHRYVYGPGPGFSDGKGGAPFSRLLKVDVATGVATVWTRPHLHCSEAIFVADPDGSAEDDGSLLSVCHDADEGRSFLLVLDARSMTELARAYTPVVVPAGFHGAWTG